MEKGLIYKGYAGSKEISLEDGCLHGRILFVNDLITYEAHSVPELETAFKDAVDRYLAYCTQTGKKPDKACSGTFNVRLGAPLHRQAATAAMQTGQTLNDFVVKAVQAAVAPRPARTVVHEHHVVVEEIQSLGQRLALSGELQWEAHGHTQH